MTHSINLKILLVFLLLASRMTGYAWVYFEHRDIGVLAIRNLSDNDRALLSKFWEEARSGYENRLSASVVDSSQFLHHTQLDYASWFAISGDHSCSPDDLLNNVLHTEWILPVADISDRLKMEIEKAKNSSQHVNYLHLSDIRLQRADPDYATRAGSNNAHFLLPRPGVDTDAEQYMEACFAAGADVNALGIYVWYHLNALMKATRCAKEDLSPGKRSSLMKAALADEAFAIHFLEDAFAAGHIAGSWGKTSVRKGTHDYYNEKGLEVVTWEGKRMIVMGDAYMRPQDATIAAAVIQLSLEQFLNAGRGLLSLDYKNQSISDNLIPDTISVCSNIRNPELHGDVRVIMEVITKTPVPGLATGLGEQPRFRSELGSFLGAGATVRGSTVFGGFGEFQKQNGWMAGLEGDIRYGFALDGVLDQAADALVFLQVGWRLDGATTSQYIETGGLIANGAITAAIPGRSAYTIRIRAPFWAVPGDLLLAAPFLLIFSPKSLTKMGVVAANGGVIPWQSSIATPIGKFQFVIGREVGVSFYGLNSPFDELIIPDENGDATILRYRSTKFEFPILEYRPFRTFSLDQSSNVVIQLSGGFDIPYGAKTIDGSNGTPLPSLRTVWELGLRFSFNWRRYL